MSKIPREIIEQATKKALTCIKLQDAINEAKQALLDAENRKESTFVLGIYERKVLGLEAQLKKFITFK